MSKRINELFLFDILIAILKIEYISSKFNSAIDLKNNFICWDSVIREFEIIGESTKTLIKTGWFEEDKKIIVDFRNILVHHYFGIDEEEVWDVIKNDLKNFKREVLNKIQQIDDKLKEEIINELVNENKQLNFIITFLRKLN